VGHDEPFEREWHKEPVAGRAFLRYGVCWARTPWLKLGFVRQFIRFSGSKRCIVTLGGTLRAQAEEGSSSPTDPHVITIFGTAERHVIQASIPEGDAMY
jgi:hypothetical protein